MNKTTYWILLVMILLSGNIEAGYSTVPPNKIDTRSLTEKLSAGEDVVEQYGNISLINFPKTFSDNLLQQQGDLLASIEDKEVRVSYLADYAQTSDQFENYEEAELIPHLKEPYRRVSGELTQAELDDLMSNNVSFVQSHFKTWANKNSIHIAYMAMMFLNSEGGTEYKLNRYLMFGGSVVRIDRIKAKQVRSLVGFDLAAGDNDTYLQDYIDELYRAMTDRGYVMTGSITHDGIQYVNNDTIYIDDEQEGLVNEYSQNQPIELVFGVNSRDAVTNVTWSESPGSIKMLSQNSGKSVSARFHRDHYTKLSRIDVDYGDGMSTVVHIMPVNLKIKFRKDTYQTNEEKPVEIEIYNNYALFYLPASTYINIKVFYGKYADNVVSNYLHKPDDLPVYEWTPDGRCEDHFARASLGHPAYESTISNAESSALKIVCGRELVGLEAIPNYYDAETEKFNWKPKRKAKEGQTIYFVTTNGNQDTRSLKVKGIYNSPQPKSQDFWNILLQGGGYSPSAKEPKWNYSHNLDERKVLWRDNEREFKFADNYFPGTFEWPSLSDAFNDFDFLDPDSYIQVLQEMDFSGVNDVNRFEGLVTYEAFKQQKSISAAFLHENRRSFDFTKLIEKFPLKLGPKFSSAADKIQNLTDLKSKAKEKRKKVEDQFPEGADENGYDYYGNPAWDGTSTTNSGTETEVIPSGSFFSNLSWKADVAYYNKEDEESPSYRQLYKFGLGGSYRLVKKTIPLFGWPNPIIKAYFYISIEGGLALTVAPTISKDHAADYLSNSYRLDKLAGEFTGKLTFAGGATLGFQDFIEDATKDLFQISGDGKLSYPFEGKIKYEINEPRSISDISEGEWIFELNHGPAVFTVILQVKLTALDRIPFLSGWDWDVVDVNYPWTLSEKRTERW